MVLAERMGALVVAARRRPHALDRHPTTTARWSSANAGLLASSVVAGVLRPMLSSNVTVVNARDGRGGAAASRSSNRRARGRATSPTCCRSSCRRARASGGSKARCSSRAARACRCSTGSTSRRRSRGSCWCCRTTISPGVIGGVGTMLGKSRHQHRQLCARARRDGSGRRRRAGLGRRRASRCSRRCRRSGLSRPSRRADGHDHASPLTKSARFREPTSGVADFGRGDAPLAAGPAALWYHAAVLR